MSEELRKSSVLMRIQVIEPHGFCAGVTNALRKAQSLLGSNSNTHQLNNSNTSIVYCLHELVHNELVVNDLKRRGMVFVESLDEVPEGQTRDDLALIIEEVLKQRMQGVKNEKGVWITPAFPKLIYVLEEENIHEDSHHRSHIR